MMIIKRLTVAAAALCVLGAAWAVRSEVSTPVAHAQAGDRVFELRTYTAHPGRFDAMKDRFRDHIVPLFTKHNMMVVGFWTAADPPAAENTLIYVLAHPSREAAKKNWDAFRADPERKRVWAETEKDGPINLKVESVYMNPVDFSPIR